MFTNLHIQNFKSWADTGEMRMAPLTGFFGTNSSGKTAILQFILMLKQTIESSDRNTILHLGGDRYSYVDLGTTYDIVHNHKFPAQIEFSITWQPKKIDVAYPIEMLEEAYAYLYQKLIPHNSSLKFNSKLNIDVDEVTLEFFNYSLEKDKLNFERKFLRINNEVNAETIIYGKIVDNFSDFADDIDDFESLENPFKDYSLISRLNSYNTFFVYFKDVFVNSYYLAPLRDYPKRTYLWSGERPQDVGKFGELTVAALLAARKTDPEVEIGVVKALQDLGLIHSFSLKPIAENRRDYEILVRRSPNSPEVLITDVGFGVSQILPVLVLCYYVPKGSTVILEQPEIHLHPSVQAKLADVFIDAIKTRNIQIIIESHSEHLLRRLQRRVAEEKDGFTNQDAALYFCDMDDNGTSQLVPLKLDTYGNINNYPTDFFGDEMGDLVAMTEAAMHRQMND